MSLYEADALKRLLTSAGSSRVETDVKDIWLCVKAVK
jgi:hypothetical protein